MNDDDIPSQDKMVPEASQQPDDLKDDYQDMMNAFEKDFLNNKVEDNLYNMDNIGNGKVVSSPAKEKEEDEEDELDEILENLGGTFVFEKKEVNEEKEIITQYSQKLTI